MNRVDELFVRALESDPGAREALLDAECDGDAALRADVQSLLDAHADAGDFMEETAAGALGALVPRLEAGAVVGGYKVVRLVGEGGSGAVYEAIQANPERRVALKVMRAGPASESERERFAREARILARLEHPAVATIYEAGADDTLSWFALEYVEGSRTLLDQAAALPVRDRLALFARVCDAIHHGHQRGLLHRDIKPANLLVDAAGRPKVIDFGIARAVEDAAGEVAGTPPYMSPEQQAGGPLDVRSDVYSLGVVLRELVPESEPDVRSIARRALALEPEARYVSAAAFGDDVRRYLAHEPVAAHPQGAFYRMRKFARRQRLAFGALLAVFVVSVAAAVVSARFAVEQSRARREAEFHSYVANISAANAGLRVGDAAEARRRLDEAPAHLRGWEWRHLMRRVDLSARTLAWAGVQVWTGALSPDGRFVAAFGIDKQDPARNAVRIWERRSGNPVRTRPTGGGVQSLAFSRDGARLALGFGSGRIDVEDTIDGNNGLQLSGHVSEVNAIVFGAERLVSVSRDETVRVWSLSEGAALHTLRGHTDRVICVCLAPDGRRALSGGREGTLRFWNIATGASLGVIEAHARSVEGVDWSRDGKTIVSACRDGTAGIWDAASRRRTATLRGHVDVARDIAIAPDARTVTTASYDRTVRLWDVATGTERRCFRGHGDKALRAAFTPGGDRVVSVSQDGTVKEWPVTGVEPVPTLRGHTDAINGVALVGDLAVTGSNDGTVRLWDARTGRPHKVLAQAGGMVWGLACGARTVHVRLPDKRLRTWSLSDGALLWEAVDVTTLATDDTKKHVVAGTIGGEVVVYESRTGAVVRRWQAHDVALKRVAAAGGRIVTTTQYGEISVWSDDGAAVAAIGTTTWPVSVAISPDRRTVAVGDYSGDIALYDMKTLRLQRLLAGHTRVTDLVYWPDGGRLAAAGWNGTIRLWDPSRGSIVAVLQGHRHSVRALALSPDGRRLLSGAGRLEAPDCVAKIWIAD